MILHFCCALVSFTSFAAALPVLTQNTSPISVQDAIETAYEMYMETQGVFTTGFYPLLGKEQQIAYNSSGSLVDNNVAMYLSADPVYPGGEQSFSQQYSKFALELSNATMQPSSQTLNSSNITGTEAGLVQGEVAIIKKLSAATTSMPVSQSNNESFAPYYDMPSLESLLTGWKMNSTPTAFNWTSSKTATNVTQSPLSNTSIFSIEAAAVQMTFGGIQLVDIDRGAWFDGFRMASAVAIPQSNDSSAQEYIGTSEAPGPAAIYNDRALVVYKPQLVMAFFAQADFDNAKAAFASNGGMWKKTILNWTKPDNTAFVLVVAPDNDDMYVVGVTARSYWDSPPSGSNSTNSIGE
ncbi:hypothetical protein B0H11DRAFT_2361257 [Mycena galericulata]|nr:hypothetical protein B0H11DRAFT_2361257 [Mycena galericulata]